MVWQQDLLLLLLLLLPAHPLLHFSATKFYQQYRFGTFAATETETVAATETVNFHVLFSLAAAGDAPLLLLLLLLLLQPWP
jgi:uncharacterized membrane protein